MKKFATGIAALGITAATMVLGTGAAGAAPTHTPSSSNAAAIKVVQSAIHDANHHEWGKLYREHKPRQRTLIPEHAFTTCEAKQYKKVPLTETPRSVKQLDRDHGSVYGITGRFLEAQVKYNVTVHFRSKNGMGHHNPATVEFKLAYSTAAGWRLIFDKGDVRFFTKGC